MTGGERSVRVEAIKADASMLEGAKGAQAVSLAREIEGNAKALAAEASAGDVEVDDDNGVGLMSCTECGFEWNRWDHHVMKAHLILEHGWGLERAREWVALNSPGVP